MDQPQTMPSIDALINNTYSVRQFLNYYLNIWTRNQAACLIDIICDETAKAAGKGEEIVDGDEKDPMTGMSIKMPIKVRLETRKERLEEKYLPIVAGITTLLALSDEDLAARWSLDALKVDEDMLPTAEPAAVAEGPAQTVVQIAKKSDDTQVGGLNILTGAPTDEANAQNSAWIDETLKTAGLTQEDVNIRIMSMATAKQVGICLEDGSANPNPPAVAMKAPEAPAPAPEVVTPEVDPQPEAEAPVAAEEAPAPAEAVVPAAEVAPEATVPAEETPAAPAPEAVA